MAARIRWLCWCCCGDGYRPACRGERGIVREVCDECNGRGWYYDMKGKPGRHMTLDEHLAELRARGLCGTCDDFQPEHSGTVDSCASHPYRGEKHYARLVDAGTRACLRVKRGGVYVLKEIA